MKRSNWLIAAACCMAFGMLGCERTTTAGGSDGRRISLNKPSDVTVKKGDTAQVTVKIERKNFRDPVSVSFGALPTGVELVDKDKQIPAEETTANFTLKANPPAAAIPDQRVDVSVKAGGDLEARESFRLTVQE